MTTTLVYLSRSFVEFGPFSVDEMKAFYSRGLLQEIDHIRPEGSDEWQHVVAWVNSIPATATASAEPAATKSKPAAKKAAPVAKKAAAPKKTAAPGKKAAKPKA